MLRNLFLSVWSDTVMIGVCRYIVLCWTFGLEKNWY